MKKILISIPVLSLLCACEKDVEAVPEEERMPVNISLSVETKVSDQQYEAGDAIGLYMVYASDLVSNGNYVDNHRYVMEGGIWNSAEQLYWKDKSSLADFYCYYPQQEVRDARVLEMQLAQNQNTVEAYKKSDVTWGCRKQVEPTTGRIAIPTSHIMSNLLIYLKPGAGFTAQEFAQATKTVKITNIKTAAKVDLATGAVMAYGADGYVSPLPVGDHYKAIIVPQIVRGSRNLIEVTINNVMYSAAYDFDFQTKTQHKITVTAAKMNSGLDISIENWTIDETDHNVTIK